MIVPAPYFLLSSILFGFHAWWQAPPAPGVDARVENSRFSCCISHSRQEFCAPWRQKRDEEAERQFQATVSAARRRARLAFEEMRGRGDNSPTDALRGESQHGVESGLYLSPMSSFPEGRTGQAQKRSDTRWSQFLADALLGTCRALLVVSSQEALENIPHIVIADLS